MAQPSTVGEVKLGKMKITKSPMKKDTQKNAIYGKIKVERERKRAVIYLIASDYTKMMGESEKP